MKLTGIVLSVLLLTLPIYGQHNERPKTVAFNLSWYPQAQFAGYFVAAEKGFYKKRGIKVRFISGNYDFSVKKNLGNGKANMGIMWLHEGIIAHDENHKIINIGQFFDNSNILIVSKKKQIRSIGIWKPFVTFLKTYIHAELSDSIEIVPLRNGNEAFIDGAVDAITVMSYNEFNQLINSGIDEKDLYIHKLSDMGLTLPEDGIYCLKSYYAKNKKTCRDFMEASTEGWQYAFNHIDEAVRICLEYMKGSNYYSNYEIQSLMLRSIKNIIGKSKNEMKKWKLNKESFDKVEAFLYKQELISSKVTYDSFCEGSK